MSMNADLDRMVRERTEALEEANRRLQEVSVTDGLTRIKNRRFFEEAVTPNTSGPTGKKHRWRC